MVADALHNAAGDNQVFGPDKVNIQQCIASGQATYYPRVSVFLYQSINKRLISASSFCAPIPVLLG
jgi:hypothetical protein